MSELVTGSEPTIGELIDKQYALRTERLELEKQVKEFKQQEKACEDKILSMLHDLKLDGAKGSKATASRKCEQVPEATNWELIYSFILEKNDFTLLHKRLTTETWRLYRDEGIIVPGTVEFDRVSLSLTKR